MKSSAESLPTFIQGAVVPAVHHDRATDIIMNVLESMIHISMIGSRNAQDDTLTAGGLILPAG